MGVLWKPMALTETAPFTCLKPRSNGSSTMSLSLFWDKEWVLYESSYGISRDNRNDDFSSKFITKCVVDNLDSDSLYRDFFTQFQNNWWCFLHQNGCRLMAGSPIKMCVLTLPPTCVASWAGCMDSRVAPMCLTQMVLQMGCADMLLLVMMGLTHWILFGIFTYVYNEQI